jgi:hypothetical protein
MICIEGNFFDEDIKNKRGFARVQLRPENLCIQITDDDINYLKLEIQYETGEALFRALKYIYK